MFDNITEGKYMIVYYLPTVPGRMETATASINPLPKESVCKQVNLSAKYNNCMEVNQGRKSTMHVMFILITKQLPASKI